MPIKKTSKTHISTRKNGASTATSARAKKASSKRAQVASKAKKSNESTESAAALKKREQLTLKAFRMAYEANQRGEFWRF
jgi:hypothetical protein